MKPKYVAFYASFFDAIEEVPKKYQADCYRAIINYALNGVAPENLKGIAKAIFIQAKPQIDATNKHRENGAKGAEYGVKGAEYGKLGGRPRKNNPDAASEENPNGGILETPQKPPETPPNINIKNNIKKEDKNKDEDLKENTPTSRSKKETTPKFNFKGALIELGVEPAIAEEWATIRKAKNKVNTELALHREVAQMNKAGLSVADAVNFCIEYQWGQFKAEWYINRLKDNNGIKVEHGYLRTPEEMQKIVECGRKLYEQSLNYK